VYRPGSGVEPPRLLREVKPDYPDAARRQGIQGEVVLALVVRRDGTPVDIRVTRHLGPEFDARAIEAVRQWQFSPGRLRGTPVDVAVEVSVDFRLR
jgi:protein TonB